MEASQNYLLAAPVRLVEGRTMIPLSSLAEIIGFEVVWDETNEAQTVTLLKDSVIVVLTKNKTDFVFNNTVLVNETYKTLDTSPQIIENSTYVPMRFFSESFGCGVDYYADTKEITIFTSKPERRVLVFKIDSAVVSEIQNTAEATIQRAAYFANPEARKTLLNMRAASAGEDERPALLVDEQSGAYIYYPPLPYNDKLESDAERQSDFTSRFSRKVNPDANDMCFSFADQLVIYNGFDKRNVHIYSLTTHKTDSITSFADIFVTADPENKDVLLIRNAYHATYVNGQWAWGKDTTSSEFQNAKDNVVSRLEYALNNLLSDGGKRNPFALGPDEIETYKSTGNDCGFTTFQILNYINENGQELPGIILVTNGTCGITDNIENIKTSVHWLNSIDPSLVRSLLTMKYICREYEPAIFSQEYYKGLSSTHNVKDGIVFINESSDIIKADSIFARLAYLFMSEAKAIQIRQEDPSLNASDIYAAKKQFVKDWTDTQNLLGVFSKEENRIMSITVPNDIESAQMLKPDFTATAISYGNSIKINLTNGTNIDHAAVMTGDRSTLIDSISGNGSDWTCTIPALSPETTYTYWIKACSEDKGEYESPENTTWRCITVSTQRNSAIYSLPDSEMMCLTFDDGYSRESIKTVINILRANKVNATFFVIGRCLLNYPDLWRQAIADGNEICYHTMYHEILTQFTDAQIINDIAQWSATAKSVLGEDYMIPGLARLPAGGGNKDQRILNVFYNHGYTVIAWNSDTYGNVIMNSTSNTTQSVADYIIKHAGAGAIPLQHFTYPDANSLSLYIKKLLERNDFILSTVSEALARQEKSYSTEPLYY